MRLQLHGEITTWNDEKGYGFITPVSGGEPVFVHIKAFKNRSQRPQVNLRVSYSMSQDKQGRSCASDVAYTGKQPESSQRRIMRAVTFIVIALLFGALCILTFVMRIIPAFVLGLYVIASIITFITYASDKHAAQNGRWRISEVTLHSMSLFGGWPGALIAQQTLRQKSRKASFQRFYKFTVIVNVAITAWLLTPRGPELTLTWLEKILR